MKTRRIREREGDLDGGTDTSCESRLRIGAVLKLEFETTTWKSYLSLIAMLRMVWIAASLFLVISLATISWAATSFYVDSAAGNDSNDGTSSTRPWQTLANINSRRFEPGDKILFRSGQKWTGAIEPHGSGSTQNPITLGAYGEGAKPVIQGNGAAATIFISEQSYWTIRDIAVTNHGAHVDERNGIMLHVSSAGVVKDIRLINVDVSDVNGEVDSKSSGGIAFRGFSKEGRPAHFDGIIIDHCTVEHVDGQGIWFKLKGRVPPRDPRWDDFHNSNVRITGTTILDTGRNAIFLRNTQSPLVDHNVIRFASARHHGNAIVLTETKDAVITENEVSNTGEHTGEGENGAFDADLGAVDTVIEYNWSHDNAGGMVNVVNDPTEGLPNDGTVIRYNLSENDKARVFGIGGAVTNTFIYNNTIFIGRGHSPDILATGRFLEHKPGDPDGILFANNVIYSEGRGQYSLNGTHIGFDSNCVFGKHVDRGPTDSNREIDDPGFDKSLLPVKNWSEIVNYRVASASRCAHPGLAIRNSGGRDILGAVLSGKTLLDRGAVASSHK
jgi:hypothetical protein